MPLTALAIDAQKDGGNQIIVSDGRSARLYTFADCRHAAIRAAAERAMAGRFCSICRICATTGTGVGCSDLGDGRHLVGLQAVTNSGQWTVRRTEIDLNGPNGRSLPGSPIPSTATSAQDPAVTSAQTISCGDLTIGQDGVQQP